MTDQPNDPLGSDAGSDAPAAPGVPAGFELTATDADAAPYRTGRPSWPFRVALGWARYAPRGKGWVPRKVGRGIGRDARDVVRTAGGAQLAVDPASLDAYCAIVLAGGWWERDVTEAVLRFVRPGTTVYDIGANVGAISAEVSARFGKAGVQVHAFEPQPSLARAVAVTAKLNDFGGLHVHPVMLGRQAGQGSLFVPAHAIHASAISRADGAAEIRCPVYTLDDLVAAGALPPPALVKIDVEGGEWDVFHGARRTLTDHRPTVVFESDVNASRFGYTRRQLCDLLRELGGYTFYAIGEAGLTPVDDRLDDPAITNMVAARPETAVA